MRSSNITVLKTDCFQISEEENDANSSRKPLVTTQFVDWSCKYFAQPVMKFLEDNDVESSLHYEREWRYLGYMNIWFFCSVCYMVELLIFVMSS